MNLRKKSKSNLIKCQLVVNKQIWLIKNLNFGWSSCDYFTDWDYF